MKNWLMMELLKSSNIKALKTWLLLGLLLMLINFKHFMNQVNQLNIDKVDLS